MEISNKFIGGNIQVNKIDGFDVFLQQEIRDTTEWWFYWHFKATANKAGTYRFHFENKEVVGAFGPAISKDGFNYEFKDGTYIDHCTFQYDFEAGETIYFAFSFPYLPSHFESFLATHSFLEKEEMPNSEKGREQYHYRFGNKSSKETILLTCRHHACEASANFALEGLVDFLYQSGLSKKYDIHIIPFVDLDGVVDGDQGKSRAPHDHNRDYGEKPIYSSIRFIKERFSKNSLAYYFDLHCPGKWGTIHNYLSIIEGDETLSARQHVYSDILERLNDGEIPYSKKNNIEYLAFWNKPSENSRSFFVSRKVKLGFTLEIPYFGELDKPYSHEGLRHLGHLLGKAMEEYDEIEKSL